MVHCHFELLMEAWKAQVFQRGTAEALVKAHRMEMGGQIEKKSQATKYIFSFPHCRSEKKMRLEAFLLCDDSICFCDLQIDSARSVSYLYAMLRFILNL